MRFGSVILAILFLFLPSPAVLDQPPHREIKKEKENFFRSLPIIVNHLCTGIERIPSHWIEKAKSDFRIAYGHTSHGSQIISGMEVLAAEDPLYTFDTEGGSGALSIWDRVPDGDLGNPSPTEWYFRTRDLLDDLSCDRNLIMWSWCGQVSIAEDEQIDQYLAMMNQLEKDYPRVVFVYMTGHLDGTGEQGNLNQRNEQIRRYCIQNNKVLFDFADIESYDPDGRYFLDKGATDNCDYDSDGDGVLDANWAVEWCTANPGQCSFCFCAHSQSLNCDLKARAFWWMLARLAGWEENLCDVNKDGYVDNLDIFEKRLQVQQRLEDWMAHCWHTMASCADTNRDGRVDILDLEARQESARQQIRIWMESCGLRKKGVRKR